MTLTATELANKGIVMYMDNIFESGTIEDILLTPFHPYTKALLSSIPVADLDRKKDRVVLKGDVPSPANPPSGCAFHPRCSMCENICKEKEPQLKTHTVGGENHFVACHFVD